MKFIKQFIGVILISLFLYSCDIPLEGINGKGDIISKNIEISMFSEINLAIDANVNITMGNDFSVEIIGEQNIIDNIKTEISDEEWNIEFYESVKRHEGIVINIAIPVLKCIEISGSGDISVTNIINSSDLNLIISGSGEIRSEINSVNLFSKISGEGSVYLRGIVENEDLRVSGTGHYYNLDLESENCDIDISGSGNCKVFVNNNLNISISGSGNVYYKGTPFINQNISGGGSVHSLD